MTSDRSIAKGIGKTYGGEDKDVTLRLLERAAQAGRADERRRISELLVATIKSYNEWKPDRKIDKVRRHAILQQFRSLLRLL